MLCDSNYLEVFCSSLPCRHGSGALSWYSVYPYERSDTVRSHSWLTCGAEYLVLRGAIRRPLRHAQAEKMVSQFEEMGNVLGDLGLALIAMAKYEDEEGARTGSYTDSSAAAKDISADSRRVGMVGRFLTDFSAFCDDTYQAAACGLLLGLTFVDKTNVMLIVASTGDTCTTMTNTL